MYDINLEREGAGFRATVEDEPYRFEVLDSQPGKLSVNFEGQPVTIYWASEGPNKWVSLGGCTYLLEKPAARKASRPESKGEALVRAPMPAQVQTIHVAEGDAVEKGETLMLLEAMKMEIRIQAPIRGKILRLPVSENQSVERDQILVEISENT